MPQVITQKTQLQTLGHVSPENEVPELRAALPGQKIPTRPSQEDSATASLNNNKP